jgi:integrase
LARLGAALALASRGYTGPASDGPPHAQRAVRRVAEDWRAIACYRLLLFTGARLTEILSLRWNWIDWDHSFARLPESKTGDKILTLTEPALVLLKEIQSKVREKYPASPFVLPGARSNTYFAGVQNPWQRIRAMAGLNEVRIHDLRHAFASTAVSAGDSLYLVGLVLGHRHAATIQRYAHLSRGPVHEVANRAAATIAAHLEANVTAGPGARGMP